MCLKLKLLVDQAEKVEDSDDQWKVTEENAIEECVVRWKDKLWCFVCV